MKDERVDMIIGSLVFLFCPAFWGGLRNFEVLSMSNTALFIADITAMGLFFSMAINCVLIVNRGVNRNG